MPVWDSDLCYERINAGGKIWAKTAWGSCVWWWHITPWKRIYVSPAVCLTQRWQMWWWMRMFPPYSILFSLNECRHILSFLCPFFSVTPASSVTSKTLHCHTINVRLGYVREGRLFCSVTLLIYKVIESTFQFRMPLKVTCSSKVKSVKVCKKKKTHGSESGHFHFSLHEDEALLVGVLCLSEYTVIILILPR